jgi:hypothetical protein
MVPIWTSRRGRSGVTVYRTTWPDGHVTATPIGSPPPTSTPTSTPTPSPTPVPGVSTVQIPTLGGWALVLLGAMLALLGFLLLRRF